MKLPSERVAVSANCQSLNCRLVLPFVCFSRLSRVISVDIHALLWISAVLKWQPTTPVNSTDFNAHMTILLQARRFDCLFCKVAIRYSNMTVNLSVILREMIYIFLSPLPLVFIYVWALKYLVPLDMNWTSIQWFATFRRATSKQLSCRSIVISSSRPLYSFGLHDQLPSGTCNSG